MKKTLTFIPLGIGISASIIYIFNVIQFRIINNSVALFQILSNLRIYLYVSIAGFICYFLVKILTMANNKNKVIEIDNKNGVNDVISDNTYEPFEEVENSNTNISYNTANSYVPNYDYVPMYQKEPKKTDIIEDEQVNVNNINKESIAESSDINKVIINGNKYCFKCGEKIYNTDNFCSHCGTFQGKNKESLNPVLKNIINVLEIVILLLIIYFSLNMLFEYKESKDSNFKSPFKVSMTK